MSDFSDIKNQRVAQLLKSYEQRKIANQAKKHNNYFGVTDTNLNYDVNIFNKRKFKASIQYLQTNNKNKWLKKKGKSYLIDFDLKERKQLKNFFNMLDKRNKGYIGLDQLQDMLLSLGLASNIQQVKQIMATVDEDHSGKIQFQQFLQMIQDDSTKYSGLVHFFKQLINARKKMSQNKAIFKYSPKNLSLFKRNLTEKDQDCQVNLIQQQLASCPKRMPFEMVVNQIRRSHILSSMNIGRVKTRGMQGLRKIQKGKQVVNAIQKMEQRKLIRSFQTTNSFFQSLR